MSQAFLKQIFMIPIARYKDNKFKGKVSVKNSYKLDIWAPLNEGVNGVNRLATKGEKILLTTDKTRKKLPTSDKKINWDLPTTDKGRKF